MSNRIRIYTIAPDSLIEVLRGRLHIAPGQLPADAQIASVNGNWQISGLEFSVRSKSFEEVPLGEVPPIVRPALFVTAEAPLEDLYD